MRTLYTVPTANGQRASIALEECELEDDARNVDLFAGEHRSEEMLAMTDLTPAFVGQFYLGALAPEKYEWGVDFYAEIIERLLKGINAHLATSDYLLAGAKRWSMS